MWIFGKSKENKKTPKLYSLGKLRHPKAVMHNLGFLFNYWSHHFDGSLAAGKDFPAGEAHGFIGRVGAGELVQALLGKRIHPPADSTPLNGAGSHGARLGAGVERAAL